MRRFAKKVMGVMAVTGLLAHAYTAQSDDQPVQANSGALTSIGSDTLREVVAQWGEAFQQQNPGITFQMEAKGSATAPPALNEGTSNLAPMSRQMTREEVDSFKQKHGHEPTEIRVALDALAVYVHKDNPIKERA